MSNRRFVIVTGYHANPDTWQSWFLELWLRHNFKQCAPERIFILANDPMPERHMGGVPSFEWISLAGDLGHCDDIIHGKRDLFMPGCPTVWMAGAWLAYGSECDMIYLEQDCLCFGPWIDRVYDEVGNRHAAFGKPTNRFPASTSLFIVKHRNIPVWVCDYLKEGQENHYNRLPENKVYRIMQRRSEDYATLNFNYDTDRPTFNGGLNWADSQPPFAAQKLTREDLLELKKWKFIEFDQLPEGIPLFSNHA